jgi:hypothetical protein
LGYKLLMVAFAYFFEIEIATREQSRVIYQCLVRVDGRRARVDRRPCWWWMCHARNETLKLIT